MIGVFDSGHGGLTVLSALVRALPDERFVYLGDHAFAPYGTRSPEEVYQLTRRRVAELIRRGCRLVIVACNTASALALRRLQQDWLPGFAPDRRVLGVFVPMIEALTHQDWYVPGPSPYAPKVPAQTVAVFATRRTVESRAFPDEVKLRAPKIRVLQQPCPHLAESIEQQRDEDLLRRGVARYVEQMLAKAGRASIDLAVLGCTHYPLVAQHFRDALPRDVTIMDQPQIVASSLAAYLVRHPEFRRMEIEPPGVEFLTSGDPEPVGAAASRYFGAPADFSYLRDISVSDEIGEELPAPDAPEGAAPVPMAPTMPDPVPGDAE